MRHLWAGSAAALLAPAAVIVSIVAAGLSGGFGGIGQVLSGPSLAPVATGALAGRHAGAPPHRRGTAAGRRVAAAAATATAVRPAVRRLVGGGSGRPPTRTPGGALHTIGGVGAGAPPRTVAVPSPPAPGSPAPPPRRPTPVDGVLSAGTKVTGELPAPAGPAATHVLQTLGSTVDRVLHKAPPLAAPRVALPAVGPS
jgi:hypothetical protein